MKKSALFLLFGVALWACQDQVNQPGLDDSIVGPSFAKGGGKPPKNGALVVEFLGGAANPDPIPEDDQGWCENFPWTDWEGAALLDFSASPQFITGNNTPPYQASISFDDMDDPWYTPCPDARNGEQCCDLDEDGVAWLYQLSASGLVEGTLEVGVGGVDSHIRLTGEFVHSDGKEYGYLLNTWPGFYPPSRCEPWEDSEGVRTTWLRNGMIGIHVWPAGKKGSKFRMRNSCYGIVDFQYRRWEDTGS